MNGTIVIHTLEELKAFLDQNGILEIALRSKDKRFKAIQKILINDLSSGQEQGLAEKVIQKLNKNSLLSQKSFKLLTNVSKIGKFGLMLNALNLCATCAGFAIMYAKLDKMSAEISQKLDQLLNKMGTIFDIQSGYEFNKVLSEHINMLDCERKQRPYSEDQLRHLVDREYNVLRLLIVSYQQDVSGDNEALIFSIFSLLAMFTVCLRKFDEIYYFNNHHIIGDENPWHSAHDIWLDLYNELSNEAWFIEKLQDYAVFEAGLTMVQTDAYCAALMEQVTDLREEVEDNDTLIRTFGDMEAFKAYQRLTTKEVADAVETAFREAGAGFEESVVTEAFHSAMQQAAMA